MARQTYVLYTTDLGEEVIIALKYQLRVAERMELGGWPIETDCFSFCSVKTLEPRWVKVLFEDEEEEKCLKVVVRTKELFLELIGKDDKKIVEYTGERARK